jgi:hypothetical protein
MYFADVKSLKQFNCRQCPETVKRQRKCQEEGFDNLKLLKHIDEYGLKVNFCPGKATWFEKMDLLFSQCLITRKTGLLPKTGSFEDQDYLFTEVFPFFVERWEYRSKVRMWTDIHEFTGKVFEAIGKMFGSK